ncbi:MAG: alanine/glycine:cation symporter family protein [Filifactoraceae bacterium]
MELFNELLGQVNDFLYGKILIALLIGTGLYFTFRTGFVQFRLFIESIRVISEKKHDEDSVSSFEALMISTASRVGVGNIAGVASAIAAGGPGAVFWMWIIAIVGSASAFIESTLAQIYKTKSGDEFRGGPAYYIEKALNSRGLGILFSILLILCFAYGFNGLQSHTITSAFEIYIGDGFRESLWPLVIGAIIALATAYVIFGGMHRIGFISSYIVPIMAFVYLAMGIYITIRNFGVIPEVFNIILKEAFDIQAISGGFAGSCVVIGIKRGLFSNEAGMGSAPNAAATADVSHPVKQGLVQVFSVFIDTMLICTTTAFMILLTGAYKVEGLSALPLVQEAVSSQVGNWGIHFITFSICTFAYSSIIGNYAYAESNIKFISDNKQVLTIFRLSCIAMVLAGSLASFDLVWNMADVFMGFMAIENILVILILGNIAIKALKDYTDQKKLGKEPIFLAKNIGLDNTDVWK